MRLRVSGQRPLNGVFQPAGNANAALALAAAVLLTDKPLILHNLPGALSVQAMLTALSGLGVEVSYPTEGSVRLQTPHVTRRHLTLQESSRLAGLMLLLPGLLVRRQHIRIEIDFPLSRVRAHLEALRDLGIDVSTTSDAIECRSGTWDFREIVLTQTSVTATGMVMMLAASLGKETIVHNAACEPHIRALADCLCDMGAHIEGIGSNVLRILAPPTLQGAECHIAADHIEAASVAVLAALSGGRLEITGVQRVEMAMIAKTLRQIGIQLDLDIDRLYVPRHASLRLSDREEDADLTIETAPWPAFPSDLVAVATLAATQARGTVLIHEKLFNNRLLFVDKLKSMGAQIVLCDPHRAIVVGPTPLRGIYMDTPDIRAGLGLFGAGLVAEGESVIDNAQVLERTFAGTIGKLQALGAEISIE